MVEESACQRMENSEFLPGFSQNRFHEPDASERLWREIRGIEQGQQRYPRLMPPHDGQDLNSKSIADGKFAELPVLQLGEPASVETTQIFRRSADAAKIYEKSKDAIVKITASGDAGKVSGTGFFVEKNGTIATDYHVIDGAKSIKLTTSDGRVLNARVDKHRSTADLAILRVDNPGEPAEFSALPLAKTAESLKSGDKVFALGHPHGWDRLYLSSGTVDDVKSGGTLGFNPQRLSVDAYVHIEPGNSGGPLLNARGEVVGLARVAVPNATEKSSTLREMIDTEALKAQFTTVDDLKALLGRDQINSSEKSYFFPERFRMHSEQVGSSLIAAGSAFALSADLRGKGTIWGNALLPAHAASKLYYSDLSFLKNAINDGTTAERINSGINVGSDLMMLSGPALRLNPRLRAMAGGIQMAGAGIRMTNDWLSGRKFD